MWLPFIGIFVGMIGMPDGDYAWSELPVVTRVSLVLVGVFMATSVVGTIGASIASGVSNSRLQATGRPAEATILHISDTGTTINKDPVVRFKLEVRPPGEPPFEAEAERLVSRLQIPMIQPGATVQVKYDPQSRAVALLDADAPSSSSS